MVNWKFCAFPPQELIEELIKLCVKSILKLYSNSVEKKDLSLASFRSNKLWVHTAVHNFCFINQTVPRNVLRGFWIIFRVLHTHFVYGCRVSRITMATNRQRKCNSTENEAGMRNHFISIDLSMFIYLELYSTKKWPKCFTIKHKNLVSNRKICDSNKKIKPAAEAIKQKITNNIKFALYYYFL